MMRLGLLGILAAAAAACHPTESGDGAEVYKTICAACHGEDGKPPPDKVTQLHPRDFTAPEFRARVTVDLVTKQVRYGSQNKLMPAFAGVLREDQITAVAEYVTKRFHP